MGIFGSLAMVPEGWTIQPLAKAVGEKGATIGGPFGSDLTQQDYLPAGVPVIRISNQQGPNIGGEFVYVSAQKADRLSKNLAYPSDIIVAQRGSTTGKVSRIVANEGFERYVICQSQMAIRPDVEAVDPDYLFQFMLSDLFARHVEAELIQTGQPHINLGILREAPTPLPPLPEQKKIAEILSTWDSAIETTVKLLANAKMQKQALMQELLTGKRRLSGFTASWVEKPMAEIATRIQRRTDGGNHPILTISSTSGFVRQDQKYSRYMAGKSVENYILLRRGEFAYNKGNSKSFEFGCVFDLEGFQTGLVPHVYVCFRLKEGLNHRFFKALFAADYLRPQLGRLVNTGVRNNGLLNISPAQFLSTRVPVPSISEQEVLGEILEAASAAVSGHQQKLDILRNEKSALMQQLLTGKRRVRA